MFLFLFLFLCLTMVLVGVVMVIVGDVVRVVMVNEVVGVDVVGDGDGGRAA